MIEKQKAGFREWLCLMALSLPTLLLSIDTGVLYLALPHISAALKADSAKQLWIMDIYGFMIAGFLIIMGNLGDRIGYRKLLIIGSTVFGLASVIAAFSTSADILIAARALMGIAGAAIMSSTLALIRNIFVDPEQRGTAISIWMSCFMAGMILGPLVGGLILGHFWWGSVFLLAVPVMIVIVSTGRILLPEYGPGNTQPADPAGAILSLVAILPFIYGLTETSRNNLTLLPALAIIVSVVSAILFIARARKATNASIDLRLFQNPVFSVTLLAMFLTAVIMGGVALFIAQYFQLIAGLSPFKAGLWMIPQALAMMIGSLLVPVATKKIKQQIVITIGLSLSGVGMVLLANVPVYHGLLLLETGFVMAVFGASPILISGTGIIIGNLPTEKAGSAASLSETSNQLGVAVGVALLGSIGAFTYRYTILKTLSRILPATALKIAAESIVSATSLTEVKNSPENSQLLTGIKEAYVSGFHVVAMIGAGIFVLLALITGTRLSHLKEL